MATEAGMIVLDVLSVYTDKFKVNLTIYEGKAKSLWTFLITFIIDVRLFSYFHKRNNCLLSTFM